MATIAESLRVSPRWGLTWFVRLLVKGLGEGVADVIIPVATVRFPGAFWKDTSMGGPYQVFAAD